MQTQDTDIEVEHTRVRLATGIDVTYTVRGNRAAAKPLVFLHGWPDSRFSFSQVIEQFDADQTLTVAYDQRGFGDADRPLEGYAIDQFAEDAVAFMDAIGVERATLIGHSFGTFVARRAAELHPMRVDRLVLIGSDLSPVNAVTLEVLESLQNLADPIPQDFVRDFQASTLQVPVPPEFFDLLVAESRKAPARVWRDAYASLLAFDDSAALARIAAPTLILWGEHDALFPDRATQEQLAAAIPNARLAVYPGLGHSPNWERPERVAADIRAFCESGEVGDQGA